MDLLHEIKASEAIADQIPSSSMLWVGSWRFLIALDAFPIKPIATRFPWIYWNLLTNPDTFRMCWREVGDEDDFVICGSKPNCKGAKESRRKLHVDLRGLRLPKDPFHLFFDGSEVASSSDKFSSWSLLLAFDCLNFGHSRFEFSKKLTS